jgi:hypothetical protein
MTDGFENTAFTACENAGFAAEAALSGVFRKKKTRARAQRMPTKPKTLK